MALPKIINLAVSHVHVTTTRLWINIAQSLDIHGQFCVSLQVSFGPEHRVMLYYPFSYAYPLKAFRKPEASKNTARDQSTPTSFEMNSVEIWKGHGCSEKI